MSDRFGRFVLLLVLSWNLILESHIYATGSSILWTENLIPSSTQDDVSQRAVTDSQGNVYVTGHSTAPTAFNTANNGDFDIFVAKVALNGTLIWGKYFGTITVDKAFAITLDQQQNPIISGYSEGNWDVLNKGQADMLIVKLDANDGTIIWQRLFGGPSQDFSYGVAVSSDNGIIASGYTTGNIPNTTGFGGESDCVLIKFNSNGAPLWNQIFGTSGADTASGLLVDPTGDIFVTGSTDGVFPGQQSYGSKDGFLVKFTSTGMNNWYRQFGTNDTDLFYSVAYDSAHNVIACGQVRGVFFESAWGGQADAACIEYDQGGTQIWAKAAGGSGWDCAWTVTVNRTSSSATAGSPTQDSIFIAGYTDGFVDKSEGYNDILLLRLDSAGELRWAEQLGSSGNDQATGVAFDSTSGNLYAVGYVSGEISGVFEDYTPTGSDAFVMLVGPPFTSKFDSGGDDKSVDKAVVVGAVLGTVLGVTLLAGVGVAGFFYMRKRSNIKMMDIFNSEDPQDSNAALSASSLPSIGSTTGSGISQKRTTNGSWEIDYSDLNLEKKIGQGSSGVVYRAKWRKTEVAVKQLLINKSSDKDIENFRDEAELMRNLRPNKNVLLYYGVCTNPLNPLCIVTEYVANGNLWTLLQNSSFKWTNALKLKIIKGVAAGMYHLAKEKLVHRDLAARNILLNEHFEAKISDFGLSRVVENEDDSNQTSTNVGPIRWMSPEAIMQRVYSEKSDVWSFAVLVYEVLTQSQPYAGVSQLNVATSIGNKQLRLNYPKDIPVISELLAKCMDWEVDNRPRFEDVVETLEHVTVNDKDQFVETK